MELRTKLGIGFTVILFLVSIGILIWKLQSDGLEVVTQAKVASLQKEVDYIENTQKQLTTITDKLADPPDWYMFRVAPAQTITAPGVVDLWGYKGSGRGVYVSNSVIYLEADRIYRLTLNMAVQPIPDVESSARFTFTDEEGTPVVSSNVTFTNVSYGFQQPGLSAIYSTFDGAATKIQVRCIYLTAAEISIFGGEYSFGTVQEFSKFE